jgi:hypothetical protein
VSLDFWLKSEPCPTCGHRGTDDLPSFNITHNLGKMAREAGVYQALWRPDEHGYRRARDIVPILERGLADLVKRPAYFQKLNAPNGWGRYEDFVPFVREVLQACKKHPDALIEVSR